MSKVSLKVLQQEAATVESCVQSVEYLSLETNSEVEELRNNWDKLYTSILDLHENLVDFIGEIEK